MKFFSFTFFIGQCSMNKCTTTCSVPYLCSWSNALNHYTDNTNQVMHPTKVIFCKAIKHCTSDKNIAGHIDCNNLIQVLRMREINCTTKKCMYGHRFNLWTDNVNRPFMSILILPVEYYFEHFTDKCYVESFLLCSQFLAKQSKIMYQYLLISLQFTSM